MCFVKRTLRVVAATLRHCLAFRSAYPFVLSSKQIKRLARNNREQYLMPYVNIKITKEGATSEQKAALITGVTQLLHDVLNKNPATTFVVIDEVDTDNWGIAGEQVTVIREREKT